MPSSVHHGAYQTVKQRHHHSYHDRYTLSAHHQSLGTPLDIATHSQHARIVEPPSHQTSSVKSSNYKAHVRSPRPYGDGIFSWAHSDLPSWFTNRLLRHRSSRRAAATTAHENILHDLRIEELRTAKEDAFHKLQSAQERFDRYQDRWHEAVRQDQDWEKAGRQGSARGRKQNRDGYGGITVERRGGELAMVKRRKRSAEKEESRVRKKERFGDI